MRRAITTLAALLAVLLLGATPAAAHGGKIKLEVAGDGATGVTVRALYQSDGHPVEDKVLRLTLTATADGGRTAGPFDLGPAAEGRGFYSSGAVLTPGRWTVVVTAADPNVIRAESTVDARTPQAAPAASTPVSPDATKTTTPETDAASGSGGTWWTVAFLVALALAGVTLILVPRRASPNASRRPTGRPVPTARPRRHG
ncbi:hypothetical protein GCM10009558_022450 [Virgisporangium aurantiacum]